MKDYFSHSLQLPKYPCQRPHKFRLSLEECTIQICLKGVQGTFNKRYLALQACKDDSEITKGRLRTFSQFKKVCMPFCTGALLSAVSGQYHVPSTSLGEGCGSEHLAPTDSQFPRLNYPRGYLWDMGLCLLKVLMVLFTRKPCGRTQQQAGP